MRSTQPRAQGSLIYEFVASASSIVTDRSKIVSIWEVGVPGPGLNFGTVR